jgi:signal transduction histidine kinase
MSLISHNTAAPTTATHSGRTIGTVFQSATVPRPVAGVTRSHAWLGLATLAALVVVGTIVGRSGNLALVVIGAAAALGAGATLFLAGPRLLVCGAVVATGGVVLVGGGRSSNVVWFAICVINAWCVLRGGTRLGATYWIGALLLFAGEWSFADHDLGWASWIVGVSVTVGSATLIRHQLTLVEQMQMMQIDLDRQSRAEERNRIARELHDVIAHSLTVSMLHVSSARLAVEHDPADAVRALLEAERLGRQSLADVRATVGLLRTAGDALDPPTPGIQDLPDLVAQMNHARVDVALLVDGDLTGLPTTTGSTAYRIVQEALTNAAKHAPGSPVMVRVTAHDDHLDVDVDSGSGRGSRPAAAVPGSVSGSGLGLLSMRERAQAVGGTCTAGPVGSRWRVHALLPRHGEPGPST